VQQPVGLLGGIEQHSLAGSAEGNLLGFRQSLADYEATDDVAAEVVEATSSREDPAAKSLTFVQDPEEDVLRLDSAASELADFRASVEEDLQRS
jgi:hypothetical protein